MKRSLFVLFSAAPLVLAATTVLGQAKPPAELAPKMQACLACHVIEGKKTIGPTYKEVAAKYVSQKDSDKMLAAKVLKGSEAGKLLWGQIPMPPNAGVSEAEALAMVKWILTIK